MAHEHTWSSLEDAEPTGANLLGDIDEFVMNTRQMVRERFALEHLFNFLANDQQGAHRLGSGRVWVGESEPASPVPSNTGAETAGTEGLGRVWFKISTGELKVYDTGTSAWVAITITAAQLAAIMHALSAKETLADNDELAITDSAATYGAKKTLWSTVKSQIAAAWGVLTAALSDKETPVDADLFAITDSAATNATKKLTWAHLKATIKTALSSGGSNALTLDNIDDGSTSKKVAAAVATILNATPPTAAGIADANLIGALSKVADLKLFINAAGTGFEYANGFKVIIATHDISTASGAKAITGVGFKPSWAIIIQVVDGTKMFSVGMSHGTSHGAAYTQDGVSADTWSYQNNKSFTALVDANNHCIGYVSSWDSDGATLTLAKTGSPTGTSCITILFGR